MNIPGFFNWVWTKKNGELTDSARLYQDELSQVLQNGLSDNGWTLPQITAANLVSIEPDMPNGTIWYEADNHEVVIKINGALRKVTTTAYP